MVIAFIIIIMAQDGDILLEGFLELAGQGGLAGAGSAGNADDDGLFHKKPPPYGQKI